MNDRHYANCILVAAQTALRSGEWIPTDETVVTSKVSALDTALSGVTPWSAVKPLFDDVCEQIGQAVTTGDWFPGDWAPEWHGCYVGDMPGGEIVVMKLRAQTSMPLAA